MLHRHVCGYRARVVLWSRTQKIWQLGKSFLHAFPAHNAGWLVLHVQWCRRQEPRFLLPPTQTSSVIRHVTSQKDVCVRVQAFCSFYIWQRNSLYHAALFLNLEGILGLLSLFRQSFEGIQVGLMKITTQLCRKNKTENHSRLFKIAKEIRMVRGFFCRGKEADFALFLQAR